MADTADQSHGVPTLTELIGERKRLRGFSYADLENRAGAVITRQRWQQLGSGVRIKEFPEPATLEAMAAALDVDVAEVVLAAARSIGLNVRRGAHSDLAARLPATTDRLSDVQRDAIVTLVRSITEVENGMEAATKQDAPSEANEDEKTRASDEEGESESSSPGLEVVASSDDDRSAHNREMAAEAGTRAAQADFQRAITEAIEDARKNRKV